MFAYFPESLQLSVLSFLPAQSLAQVACTSKDFNDVSKRTAALVVSWLQKEHFASSMWLPNPKEDCIALLRDITRSRILCIGGAYTEFSMAELNHHGKWSNAGETMSSRDGSDLVMFGGCVYSIGGEGDSATSSIERYDILLGQWVACSSLMRPVRQASAVACGNNLMVIGGEDVNSSNVSQSVSVASFSSLNSMHANWRELGNGLNAARKGHSAVIYNGKLWVAGGLLSNGEISNTVEVLDLDGGNTHFEATASMVYPRKNFKLVVVRDQLFAVGGDSNSTIESYDEYTETWMLETTLPCYRRNFSVCVNDDKICIFGGQDKRCKGLRSVDVYDVTNSDWGFDCNRQYLPVAGAGAGCGPRKSSFASKNSKKSPVVSAVTIKQQNISVASEDFALINLEDFASGFVCGQSVSLDFKNMTW